MQQQVPRCNPRSFGRVASLPRVGLAWRAINLIFLIPASPPTSHRTISSDVAASRAWRLRPDLGAKTRHCIDRDDDRAPDTMETLDLVVVGAGRWPFFCPIAPRTLTPYRRVRPRNRKDIPPAESWQEFGHSGLWLNSRGRLGQGAAVSGPEDQQHAGDL